MAWIKIAHLIGMLMWFGTIIITHGTMARNLGSADKVVRQNFSRVIHNLNLRYLLPGVVLSAVTGTWLVLAYYGWAAGYVQMKIALGFLAIGVTLYSIYYFRQVRRLADGPGPEDSSWPKIYLTWRILTQVVALLLLVVLSSALLKFG